MWLDEEAGLRNLGLLAFILKGNSETKSWRIWLYVSLIITWPNHQWKQLREGKVSFAHHFRGFVMVMRP